MYQMFIPVPDIFATDDAADLCEAYLATPEGEERINTREKHTEFHNALCHGLWGIAATSRTTFSIEHENERLPQ